jgi:hypothetical protein
MEAMESGAKFPDIGFLQENMDSEMNQMGIKRATWWNK